MSKAILADDLFRLLRSFGNRVDSIERTSSNFNAPQYTIASTPASGTEGAIIYVSDEAAGSKFKGWDGSSWVALG